MRRGRFGPVSYGSPHVGEEIPARGARIEWIQALVPAVRIVEALEMPSVRIGESVLRSSSG